MRATTEIFDKDPMLCVEKYRSGQICSIKLWPVDAADFMRHWDRDLPGPISFVLSNDLEVEGIFSPTIKHSTFTRLGRHVFWFQSRDLCQALKTKDLKRAAHVTILMHEKFSPKAKHDEVFQWLDPRLPFPEKTGGKFMELYISDSNALHLSFNNVPSNLHHLISFIAKWCCRSVSTLDVESIGVLNSLLLSKACFSVFEQAGRLVARPFPAELLRYEKVDAIKAHVGHAEAPAHDH